MNDTTNTAQTILEGLQHRETKTPFPIEGPTGGAIWFSHSYGGTGIGVTEPASQSDEYSPSSSNASAHRAVVSISNQIDLGLLKKAMELVESIDPDDQFETQLQLVSLAGTLMETWETAAECSEAHQDVLAILENGIRQAARDGMVTEEQLSATREALRELSQPIVVPSAVDTIRTRFVSTGFGPMAFAEDIQEAP